MKLVRGLYIRPDEIFAFLQEVGFTAVWAEPGAIIDDHWPTAAIGAKGRRA
jgi:hypothetical protein